MSDIQDESNMPLSTAGQRRREEILAVVKAEVASARKRRHMRRSAAAIAAALVLCATTFWLARAPNPTTSSTVVASDGTPQEKSETEHSEPTPTFIAQNDAETPISPVAPHVESTVDFAVVRDAPPALARISDDELIRMAAEAGRPLGLVTIGGLTRAIRPSEDDAYPAPEQDANAPSS